MIVGDNTAGHGFVLRDLVLIELSGHATPPPPVWGRGVKNFGKVFAGGVRNFNFAGGVLLGGGGHLILK